MLYMLYYYLTKNSIKKGKMLVLIVILIEAYREQIFTMRNNSVLIRSVRKSSFS